jgi:hypothetical protein
MTDLAQDMAKFIIVWQQLPKFRNKVTLALSFFKLLLLATN